MSEKEKVISVSGHIEDCLGRQQCPVVNAQCEKTLAKIQEILSGDSEVFDQFIQRIDSQADLNKESILKILLRDALFEKDIAALVEYFYVLIMELEVLQKEPDNEQICAHCVSAVLRNISDLPFGIEWKKPLKNRAIQSALGNVSNIWQRILNNVKVSQMPLSVM